MIISCFFVPTRTFLEWIHTYAQKFFETDYIKIPINSFYWQHIYCVYRICFSTSAFLWEPTLLHFVSTLLNILWIHNVRVCRLCSRLYRKLYAIAYHWTSVDKSFKEVWRDRIVLPYYLTSVGNVPLINLFLVWRTALL